MEALKFSACSVPISFTLLILGLAFVPSGILFARTSGMDRNITSCTNHSQRLAIGIIHARESDVEKLLLPFHPWWSFWPTLFNWYGCLIFSSFLPPMQAVSPASFSCIPQPLTCYCQVCQVLHAGCLWQAWCHLGGQAQAHGSPQPVSFIPRMSPSGWTFLLMFLLQKTYIITSLPLLMFLPPHLRVISSADHHTSCEGGAVWPISFSPVISDSLDNICPFPSVSICSCPFHICFLLLFISHSSCI